MANRKILITGGGTGGHLFPALAIGEEINSRDPMQKSTMLDQHLVLRQGFSPSRL